MLRVYDDVSWLYQDLSEIATVVQPAYIIRTQYTKCPLLSAS
jgi:hypothetical protein